MRTRQTQLEAHKLPDTDDLLRAAGVKRIHAGWYTVRFCGVIPDSTTVTHAKRNPRGDILPERD